MVRERIKELVDFATTESPYRDATKGWLTDDVYIQWGAAKDKPVAKPDEFANVSVYLKPINQLLTILFIVIVLASIFVFSAVSLAHGRFQFSTENETFLTELAPLEVNDASQVEQIETLLLDQSELNSAAETKLEPEKVPNTKSTEFAAAALGGQQLKR